MGREAAALLLLAAAAYLGLALASLQPPATGLEQESGNWVGPVGAWLAQAFVTAFGAAAWLLPIELVLMATPVFRELPLRPLLGRRLAGDLVLWILLASLLHVALPDSLYQERGPIGGDVGLFFGEILRALFSTLGSFLIGGTAVALLLIARSAFSFIEWCDRALAALRRLQRACAELGRRLARAWREARRLRQQGAAALGGDGALQLQLPGFSAAALDGGAAWQPREQTGVPPLAVSSALRSQLGLAAKALLEADTRESAGAEQAEPSPAPPRPRRRRAKAAEKEKEKVEAEEASEEPEEEADEPAPVHVPMPVAARKSSAAAPTIVDTRPHSRLVRSSSHQEETAAAGDYVLPSTELLQPTPVEASPIDRQRVLELAQRLEATLANYGVVGKVEEIHPGPTVTTYEVSPQAGTKVSKVAGMSDDLALGLSRKVRIIAPIPGKSRIGFELPNDARAAVNMRELIEDARFEKLAERAPLPVVMGRDIVGGPFYADLAAMPHVIVAGATGAGKSVGVNVMLCSLLFRRTPAELRMLMIDPKVVELAPFDGIPHMLLPVVTDMKQAAKALKWAVDEMERRYQAFASAGTKNITTYNRWVDRVRAGELPAPSAAEMELINGPGAAVTSPIGENELDAPPNLPDRLPYIVIVVDEFADLMMQQGKDVEASVARLAQKARAAGMHVVLATQRPSVDVITGMIKANFPTRIAFRVAQKVDSRTILDEQGAELLLGRGDSLVKMNGSNETLRVQCPFISEEEVSAITDHLRRQGTPVYHDDILKADDDEEQGGAADEPVDPRFDEAVRIVAETRRCSTSWLQRKLGIGYNRAAKIVEMMEHQGMVGPPNGSKEREICIQPH
ncbi:MAG TPA: DNA translocase FtsK 4TM domain-containing protein [Polyangiaceae bacterium]|nr:DNA translocase FtsK 4TM domain-containing protein [Polyangiaceae bacterium]